MAGVKFVIELQPTELALLPANLRMDWIVLAKAEKHEIVNHHLRVGADPRPLARDIADDRVDGTKPPTDQFYFRQLALAAHLMVPPI